MLISNQSNLNILLSNNQALLNKILDSSLDSELKSILTNQNSGADVLKIIKELFLALKDGSKSATNLENLLKNLNFSKSLELYLQIYLHFYKIYKVMRAYQI